jgi:hypothetical protein
MALSWMVSLGACTEEGALGAEDEITEGGTAAGSETGDEDPLPDTGEGSGLCAEDPTSLVRPEHWTRASHCKYEDANYELLFPDDEVQRLDIIMSPEDAQAMYDDLEQMLGPFGGGNQQPPGPSENEDPIYIPTTVRFGEHTWTEVGMRYKGNSSLKFAWSDGILKLSFRLHFDNFADETPELEDQRFWGFRKMTFASAYKDPSYLRDKVAAEVFRDFGVPAARSSYVELWVDQGEGPAYWGVYVMIEDPSDELVQTQFSEGGNLYKPEGPGADWTYFDQAGFVKKTNEDSSDWSDVEAAIEALHADPSDDAAWRAQLDSTFDVEHFLRFLAVNQTLQNWDTYGVAPHNYYVYADPDDGHRLTWIPWDLNLTFFEGSGGHTALSILLEEVNGASWPLIRFVLDDPVYGPAYLAILGELYDTAFDVNAIENRMIAYHDLVAPYVADEVAPYTHLVNDQEFADSLYELPTAIIPKLHERRDALEAAIAEGG